MKLLTVDWSSLLELPDPVFIDVRSPSEFNEDHAPAALSVPLFEDDQRACVGLLYSQKGPEAAFETAASIVRKRVAGMLTDLREHIAVSEVELQQSHIVALYDRLLELIGPRRLDPQISQEPYNPSRY